MCPLSLFVTFCDFKGSENHCERNWLNFKPLLITPQNILVFNSGNICIGTWDSSPLTESWVRSIFLTWNQNQNLVFGPIYLTGTAREHLDSVSWVTGACSLIMKAMAWSEWTQQMVGGEEGNKYGRPEGVCLGRRRWNRWHLLVDVVSIDRFFSDGNYHSMMCSDGHKQKTDRPVMLAKA